MTRLTKTENSSVQVYTIERLTCVQEKKRVKKETGKSATEWEGSHPWRPFDREKDLEVTTRPRNQKEFLFQMGDLSGRFGTNANSSGGARKFL